MQAIRTVVAPSSLGLFGLAGFLVNYCAPASATFNMRTENHPTCQAAYRPY
jgi:hypothetical protein